MKRILIFLALIIFPCLLMAQGSRQILVSDGDFDNKSMVYKLKKQLSSMPETSAWVITGDFLPACAYDEDKTSCYEKSLLRIRELKEIAQNFAGEVLILPDEMNWLKGHHNGFDNLDEFSGLLAEHFPEARIVPEGSCPGPYEIPFGTNTMLVFLDTQWWLHGERKTDVSNECPYIKSETGAPNEVENNILSALHDIIARNPHRNVLIFGHHPLQSRGIHGGGFPLYAQLFPLRLANKSLWVPLPGFLYTGYRASLGEPQDLAHPEYRDFRKRFMDFLSKSKQTAYISGHDHMLEFDTRNLAQVQSGSLNGAPAINASVDKEKRFSSPDAGFVLLDIQKNGSINLIIKTENPDNQKETLLIPAPDFQALPDTHRNYDYTDSTAVCPAGKEYEAGGWHRFWLGDNYRKEWALPDTFAYFDILKEKDGLVILQRGGGFQTSSYRLQAPDGRQYVLRSVDKSVDKVMTEEFAGTVAQDVLQDMISASFPYGALVVPPLAEATGVYHTNPRYVYMPDDPALGIYRNEMKNKLFLFEERPAGNRTDVAGFGRPEDMESTSKVLKKTSEKHKSRIDQQQVLRSRMLDIFIGDWDRHDDQWRWSVFEGDGFTTYKPVPRDRDNAFFKGQGPLLWVASRKWMLPKFQGFDATIRDIAGLEYNARHFDRSFLNEADRNLWEKTAREFIACLTDSLIENSVKNSLPASIDASRGEELITKMKARREHLPEYFEEYYEFLSREVDIPGTKRRELFIVDRISDDSTRVEVIALSDKKGRKKNTLYDRTFENKTTKEINLYGRKGDDEFIVRGNVKKSPLVRIIGGKGDDVITDSSHVGGLCRKTRVYDKKKNTLLHAGRETSDRLSNRKGINKYDRLLYEYDVVMPLVNGGYNPDDGVFIGGGALFRNFNWRDSSAQSITASAALATGAYNIHYKAAFSNKVGQLDFLIKADLSVPEYVNNFYGFGNETTNDSSDKDFYRVRYEMASVRPALRLNFGKEYNLSFGPQYLTVEVEKNKKRILDPDLLPPYWKQWFTRNHFVGLALEGKIDKRNNDVLPSRGLFAKLNYDLFRNFTAGNYFSRLQADARYYISFHRDPGTVLALRAGYSKTFGDYPFYFASALGGNTNLRGYRGNRFTGDEALYQNTELRVRIFRLHNYLLNGDVGILGFYDCGRVWYADEKSDQWHHGYGGGIWAAPYKFLAINAVYEHSSEADIFSLKFSFQY